MGSWGELESGVRIDLTALDREIQHIHEYRQDHARHQHHTRCVWWAGPHHHMQKIRRRFTYKFPRYITSSVPVPTGQCIIASEYDTRGICSHTNVNAELCPLVLSLLAGRVPGDSEFVAPLTTIHLWRTGHFSSTELNSTTSGNCSPTTRTAQFILHELYQTAGGRITRRIQY